MSFGFKILDSGGTTLISPDTQGIGAVDVFEVDPTTAGSRTYQELAAFNVVVTQSAVEPSTITRDSITSFNAVSISVANAGTSKVVSWQPLYSSGVLFPVVIFVLVL
jgi:hypothetical protein